MANEAVIINNPTSTPAAVSTGYQRQNTRAEAGTNGLDCSYVSAGLTAAAVILKTGGPVDYNGVLYSLGSDVTFTLVTAGRYYVYLEGAEAAANLTPTIGTDAGTFDASKNGRYLATGRRVLNWIIEFDGTTAEPIRLLTPYAASNYIPDAGMPEESIITSNGTWIAPRTKFYDIWMAGKGGAGGAANLTSSGGTGYCYGGNGGGGAVGKKRILITAGTTWTATFATTSGGNLTFTDGSTSLIIQNGYTGSAATLSVGSVGTGFGYGDGGLGGSSSTNMDVVFPGGDGSRSAYGGVCGSCHFGQGGLSRIAFAGDREGLVASGVGVAGKSYGGGGGGAYHAGITSGSSAGGAGAVGVIRIIG